jgi:large subunit ribosomal protein L10
MKKEQKTAIVQRLTDNLGRAKIALVTEYSRMKAGEADDMRRRLRAADSELAVAKNTLVRLAIKPTKFAALDTNLGGPIGLLVGYADPVEFAKTVGSFKDLGDKFKVRGGVLDGKPLTPEEISALAALPPREVIFAQLLGLLQAPATRLARLLNEPGSAMARVLDAIGKRAPATEAPAAVEAPGASEVPVATEPPVASETAAAAPSEPASEAAPSEESGPTEQSE